MPSSDSPLSSTKAYFKSVRPLHVDEEAEGEMRCDGYDYIYFIMTVMIIAMMMIMMAVMQLMATGTEKRMFTCGDEDDAADGWKCPVCVIKLLLLNHDDLESVKSDYRKEEASSDATNRHTHTHTSFSS